MAISFGPQPPPQGGLMNAMPRIYVVDDDEPVRASLNVLLEADHDVMCFAAARPFLDVAAALLPG